MNIDTIYNILKTYIKQDKTFYYVGMRGQNEMFRGRIVHIYPRTFLVETTSHVMKSFSYSDYATKSLKIV